MKKILVLTTLLFLVFSCEKEETIDPTYEFQQSFTGHWSLDTVSINSIDVTSSWYCKNDEFIDIDSKGNSTFVSSYLGDCDKNLFWFNITATSNSTFNITQITSSSISFEFSLTESGRIRIDRSLIEQGEFYLISYHFSKGSNL